MGAPAPEKVESFDMTPMIDVVFQLLIFFMLTMNFPDVEKGAHEAGTKDGGSCALLVEQVDLGRLDATALRPDRAGANRALYIAAAARTRAILDTLGGAPIPVILDSDGEVPYEHVLGVVNALQELAIRRIEFAASPRLGSYHRAD